MSSFPRRQRRQAHQDRVDIAAGLEAEQGAPVVDEVEFGVAAAPFELPGLVLFGEGRLHPPPHQFRIDVQERLADLAGEGEIGVEEAFQVIVERSEEHTSELQSLMRISYAVFLLKKKKNKEDDIRR